MNVIDHEIWSKQKAAPGIHTECGRLVHASLRWSCSRQEWGKNGQWQLRIVCSWIWIYIKRHKEAHSFCCVNVYMYTRKRMWKARGLIQCKSSGVGLWKCSLSNPQSLRIRLASGKSLYGYNCIQVCEEVKVLHRRVETGRRSNKT